MATAEGRANAVAMLPLCGWPVRNLVLFMDPPTPTITPDEAGRWSGGPLRPYPNQLADWVAGVAVNAPKMAIAALAFRYTVDLDAAARGWEVGWVAAIVARDLFLMVAVAGLWDYLLYFSPLKERMRPWKINDAYPGPDQLKRDVFWTTSATLLASAQEVALLKWWCGQNFTRALFGAADEAFVPVDAPFFSGVYAPYFVAWALAMFYVRITHFYVVHRAMHPWFARTSALAGVDPGRALYRYVHSHHHKSHNPTAFSGISMTPVESVAYFTAALVPLAFRSGCHPWLHLFYKLDCAMGAQVAHCGFDGPGGASYFHQLHHAHFECNYGDAAAPIDWLMGTFEDGSSYAKKKAKKAA